MLVLAALDTSPGPFIALLLFGFLIGTFGHIYKSNVAIAAGIALIFCSTIVLPGIVFFLR